MSKFSLVDLPTYVMPRTHEAYKLTIFAHILDPYEVTLFKFSCSIKHPLFEQNHPELLHTDLKFEQIKSIFCSMCTRH